MEKQGELGARGSILYTGNDLYRIPTIPTKGDSTGAADMFGGAFLIEYLRTEDPVLSAYLASAATSFAIGRSMLSGWIN